MKAVKSALAGTAEARNTVSRLSAKRLMFSCIWVNELFRLDVECFGQRVVPGLLRETTGVPILLIVAVWCIVQSCRQWLLWGDFPYGTERSRIAMCSLQLTSADISKPSLTASVTSAWRVEVLEVARRRYS